MSDLPEKEYQKNIERYRAEVSKLKKTITFYVLLRVGSFLITAGLIYVFMSIDHRFSIVAAIAGLIVFLFIVKRHLNLKKELKFAKELRKINQEELKALKGEYSAFATGEEFFDIDHPYSYDLDIFGKNSLFQMISRNALSGGSELTADILKGQNKISTSLEDVQQAVKELSTKHKWRQDFQAWGRLSETSQNEQRNFFKWMNSFPSPVLNSFYQIARWVVPIISCSLVALIIFGLFSFNNYMLFIIIPAGIMISVIKLINYQYSEASKNRDVIKKYYQLLKTIEDENFDSPLLKEIKSDIVLTSGSASEEIRKMNSIMNSFDNRNGMLIIVLYLLFLSDIQILFRLGKWIGKNKEEVPKWIDVINKFDVLSSFGTFAFNNKDFIYPSVSSKEIIEVEAIGHPFLSHEKCITNNFSLKNDTKFSIVTGANMAGKSTFLRTIGVNLVMANSGLPVLAKKFVFAADVPIYSSMRTTDSLQQHESYFYTELKRLHELIDILDKGERRFIILDEILKGTNSKDKATGSKKFMEKLLKLNAAGIIATHDLSLCELGSTYPELILNQCFEVETIDDKLVFDYKLRNGVCQNMNATFLMTKMGII